ncbi:MAG: hypothetical protein HS104_38895 [Polyangiaceae bacterium]|nr:hypothetical protein [Polyangiaceae bacterium]MBK8996108.1 hypothetical protein [Myxococcales bacterium]MCE7890370.1 hypothetical protein [Sorangiineae bacterium PRO1]MCL4756025.1 hypothetical protein [Myxococcales bacterium]
MPIFVLDSGGLSRLAERSQRTSALLAALRREELWPPLVPGPVLIECLTGHSGRDANVNRLLRTCNVEERVSEVLARRAAALRFAARRGSAVDALVVASAEPDGVVLTSDVRDLRALAAHSHGVIVERA